MNLQMLYDDHFLYDYLLSCSLFMIAYLRGGLDFNSCISCRSSLRVEWRLANSLLTLAPAPLEEIQTEWSTLNDKRCINSRPETPTRHPAPTAAQRLHLARKCSRNCCSKWSFWIYGYVISIIRTLLLDFW